MAIIEIAPGQAQGTKGIEKKIDQRSEKMIMNILQAAVYSYPVESCVRESASNMVDAIDEKNIAKSILKNESSEADHFIQREGEEYEDSKFDRSYYDLNWLSNEDICRITYREKDGVGFCDTVEFYDTGVGLSPERFLKATGLAFSTKRNTNKVRGGFGMGLKSPLATDVDFFTVESSYNGMKIIANCYKYQTIFVTPKFNLETGQQNPSVQVQLGDDTYIIYYEPTTEKNYTKITVPSKKINRSKYRDAVENQLMYIDRIKFKYIYEGDLESDIDFAAKVLYNSKNIIISDNKLYNKPHIIIVKSEDDKDGICYGQLDFKELELEEKFTSVGIKCLIRSVVTDEHGRETVVQEGVAVTPSREKVIFNEATKNYLTEKFKAVVAEATAEVESKLKETELVAWLKGAANIISARDERSVIGRMGKLVDLAGISPTFPGDRSIRYAQSPSHFFRGFNVRINRISTKTKYVNGKNLTERSIERNPITAWNDFVASPIYFQEGPTAHAKDNYLGHRDDMFITIQLKDIDDFLETIASKQTVIDEMFEDGQALSKDKDKEERELKRREKLLELLKLSPLVKGYDDVVIPEEWLTKFEALEASEQDEEKQAKLTDAERRALEEKVPMHIPTIKSTYPVLFSNSRSEIKFQELLNAQESIIYGTSADKEMCEALCQIAHGIVAKRGGHRGYFWDSFKNTGNLHVPFKLIVVSEQVAKKYCKNLMPVKKAMLNLNKNFEFEPIPMLKKWYTANAINEHLHKFVWLRHAETVCITGNPHIRDMVKNLFEYVETYKGEFDFTSYYGRNSKVEEIKENLKKFAEFQLFVRDHNDTQAVADKASEMFSTTAVKNAHILDMEVYEQFEWLLTYVDSMYPVVKNLVHQRYANLAEELHGSDDEDRQDCINISPQMQFLFVEYAKSKGVYDAYCNTPAKFIPASEAEPQVEADLVEA